MSSISLDTPNADEASREGAANPTLSAPPLDEERKRNVRERVWALSPEHMTLTLPCTEGVPMTASMVKAGAMELETHLGVDSEITSILVAKLVYAAMHRVAAEENTL